MLHALSIRNILLIESLDLDFQSGLNVLTGETGAGKSILLDALGFVLGWRGKADIVRQGADMGEVTAEFDLFADHPARAVLTEAGFDVDNTLIIRRTNNTDGRKRAYVNDRACSGEILRKLSDTLIELHGQHDDKGLLDPKQHRYLLDDYAGVSGELAATSAAWRNMSTARNNLEQAEQELLAASADAEYLRHSLEELEALSPLAGEDAQLDAQRRLMQSAARIREDIVKAANAVSQDGAERFLSDASRWLDDVAGKAEGRLDGAISALGRSMSELADAQKAIGEALDALDFNPSELEQTEERLFAIRGMARKHSVQPDELAGMEADFRTRLEHIDTGAQNIGELKQLLADALETYDKSSDDLSAKRIAAAATLDKSMGHELAPLKMERAIFTTEITESDQPGPGGKDKVLFLVSTNPGSPSGPINHIASGGELSRFLLALKVCLTSGSSGLSLIFDEIDRGVSGATADAIGRRLYNLASNGQVLVVTHSPQVAALGQHHWQVSKSDDGVTTTTDVRKLDEVERTDEIARLLSGDTISEEARSAAKVLLGKRGRLLLENPL